MNDGKCFLFFLFLWAFTAEIRCEASDHSRLKMMSVESGKSVQSTKHEYKGSSRNNRVTTLKLNATPAVTINYSTTISPFLGFNITSTTHTAKDINVTISATATNIQYMNYTKLATMILTTNGFVPKTTNQSSLSTAASFGKLTMKNTNLTSMNLTTDAFVTKSGYQSSLYTVALSDKFTTNNTKLTSMHLTTEASVTKATNQSSLHGSVSSSKQFTYVYSTHATASVKNISMPTSKKYLHTTNKINQSTSVGQENGTTIGQLNRTHHLTSDETMTVVPSYHHVASETNLGEKILVGFEKKDPLTISLVAICGAAPIILVLLVICIIRRRRRSTDLVVDDTYQDVAVRIFRNQGKQSAQEPRTSGNHASIDFNRNNPAQIDPLAGSKTHSTKHHIEIHEENKDYKATDFLDHKKVNKQQITENDKAKDGLNIDHPVRAKSSSNQVDISNSLNEEIGSIQMLTETTPL